MKSLLRTKNMKLLNALLCTLYLQCPLFFLALFAYARLFPYIIAMMIAADPDASLPIPFGLGITSGGYRGAAALFTVAAAALSLSIIAYLTLLTLSFVAVAKEYKRGDTEALCQKMKRVKFGYIPFWAASAAALSLIYAGGGFLDSITDKAKNDAWGYFLLDVWRLSFFAKYYVFSIIGLLYVHIILSSRFSFAYLKLLRKAGAISKRQFAVHAVLQLLFIADVFDTAALVKRHGRA